MMRYFDSREHEITVEHIMASGALPPAFPAVRIDGELYWDGGILSNTPTEAIFDDNPRRNSLIFAVHMWNPQGPEPETIWEVLHRQKDIQYSSRIASHIARQQQVHRLRHVISELVRAAARGDRARARSVRELAGYGCLTQHARGAPAGAAARQREPHQGHRLHRPPASACAGTPATPTRAGRSSRRRGNGEFDPLDGVILHEQMGDDGGSQRLEMHPPTWRGRTPINAPLSAPPMQPAAASASMLATERKPHLDDRTKWGGQSQCPCAASGSLNFSASNAAVASESAMPTTHAAQPRRSNAWPSTALPTRPPEK